MKKVTKRLTILLPITVITEVILLIVMVILSISHFSFLSMFLPFSTPWSSNFILDICLKNTICVLAAAIIIIIVQLVSYHHFGERALRYHKKISLILTAVFILVLALAIVLPISRYSYQHVEFSTYMAVEPRANDTELKSDDKNRLPYNDEFMAAGGTDGYIDEYITFGNKYACVFQDGENNMRYICELFQSDSKLLCSNSTRKRNFILRQTRFTAKRMVWNIRHIMNGKSLPADGFAILNWQLCRTMQYSNYLFLIPMM